MSKLNHLDIGKHCVLRVLKLYAGKEPFDLPQFIITAILTDGVLISDRAERTFIVRQQDIQVI